MDEWRRRRLKAIAKANGDRIELLLADAIDNNWCVELDLRSGKSYIGFPTHTPMRTACSESADESDLELIPLFSGYRTEDTRELRLTRYYGDDIDRLIHDADTPRPSLSKSDFRIVIPSREVVLARLFDPKVFAQLGPGLDVPSRNDDFSA